MARRTGNLWETLVSFKNLHLAARKALKGKRNRPEPCEFHHNLETSLFLLQRKLQEDAWRPGPGHSFWIREPKRRCITAASFLDRVVHHALIQAIEPVFERRFIHHSYACRTGKGQHQALAAFTRWARGTETILKLDLRKYFPSIDHLVLKEVIGRCLKDQKVLTLCDRIIDGAEGGEEITVHVPGDDLFTPLARRRGLPIGNLTSQFFGNVVLDPVDHFVTDKLGVRRYLRYADDLVICHSDKSYLSDLRAKIRTRLHESRLILNDGKSRVRRLREGVEFLGFVVLPDRIRLNQRALRCQRRRLRALQKLYREGALSWDEVKASLQAWNAHAAHGDCWRLREDVFGGSPFRR